MATLWDSIKEKIGIVIMTGAVGFATVFSDHIISSVKEKVNIAEKRPAIQDRIAKQLSSVLYDAEMAISYARNNFTDKEALMLVNKPFNISIEVIRKNEYADKAAIERYWGENAPAVNKFSKFHEDIRNLEGNMHAFNQEYSLVLSGKKYKADPKKTKPLVSTAENAFGRAKKSANELLSSLRD